MMMRDPNGVWLFPIVMAPVMLAVTVMMLRKLRGRPPRPCPHHRQNQARDRPDSRSPEHDAEANLQTLRQRYVDGEVNQEEYEHALDLLLGLHQAEDPLRTDVSHRHVSKIGQ